MFLNEFTEMNEGRKIAPGVVKSIFLTVMFGWLYIALFRNLFSSSLILHPKVKGIYGRKKTWIFSPKIDKIAKFITMV